MSHSLESRNDGGQSGKDVASKFSLSLIDDPRYAQRHAMLLLPNLIEVRDHGLREPKAKPHRRDCPASASGPA